MVTTAILAVVTIIGYKLSGNVFNVDDNLEVCNRKILLEKYNKNLSEHKILENIYNNSLRKQRSLVDQIKLLDHL